MKLDLRRLARGWTAPWAALVLAAFATVPASLAGEVISGQARAIDAATLDVAGTELVLFGIRAPDLAQICWESHKAGQHPYPCGQYAFAFLSSLVVGEPVVCVTRDEGAPKHRTATCWAEGRDIAGAVVAAGWALADSAASWRYQGPQDLARRTQVGMWAGTFEEPARD